MTPHELRARQRLLSDETCATHEALARARWAELNRQRRRRRWSCLLLVIAVIAAIALAIGLILAGGAQLTVVDRG